MKLTRDTLGGLLLLAALVNFGVFALSVWLLGGEAVSGKIENGVHYVGYRGTFTRVSPGVWWYSLIQTCSMFLTHGVAIFGGWLLGARGKRKAT